MEQSVWPPRSSPSFHFHPSTRAWPQMLTKLVGGWLPLLVSVHSFHVGSGLFPVSSWCSFRQTSLSNDLVRDQECTPQMPLQLDPHLGSKPLNAAIAWIKHEFIPCLWPQWSIQDNFLLLSPICKEFQAYLMSTDVPFRTLTVRKEKITKSRYMSS